MTYNAESVTGNLPDLKVKFNVEMYVDERLSDTYNEVYIFSYDQANQIKNIHLEGKNDNVLKTLLPSAQSSFRDFAKEIITKQSDFSEWQGNYQANFEISRTDGDYRVNYEVKILGKDKISITEKINDESNNISDIFIESVSDDNLVVKSKADNTIEYIIGKMDGQYYLMGNTIYMLNPPNNKYILKKY